MEIVNSTSLKKPKFPSKNKDGEPASGAKLVCLYYTMAAIKQCHKGKKCSYAHIDGDTTERDFIKFSGICKFLGTPEVKGIIVLTADGKRLSGSN